MFKQSTFDVIAVLFDPSRQVEIVDRGFLDHWKSMIRVEVAGCYQFLR
jgi:hypothetical protein